MTPLQHLPDLWRTHNGPQGLYCLIIGKVFRWRQIRTQGTQSVPQSPLDQAIVLHEWRKHRVLAVVVYNSTDYHVIWLWRLKATWQLVDVFAIQTTAGIVLTTSASLRSASTLQQHRRPRDLNS
jgi:hypothetical protein